MISGVLVVGALAQADGAHLRQRSDRLGESLPNRLNSGNERGGHRSHAHNHHSQFALRGRNRLWAAAAWPLLFLLVISLLSPLQ